ncbi:MAG: thiamine-phosphate kinase [Petrotogales bacterium]
MVKKLSELGERKAIRLVSGILSKGEIAVGIGDDCAAFEFGERYLLVTTDMISQKTHMPKDMTPFQIGWFIVAINLSDIAAKGGTPLGLVLSYGLPEETSEAFLKELTKGANVCATSFETNIVGGDMKEADNVTICGTAFGIVKKEEFMPRIGTNSGDVIAVTGTLGKAGAGYYNLKNKIKGNDISKALLEPMPKLKEGQELARQKCVTSSMDISDGLSSSLYQLMEVNRVGFEINLSSIPISSELIQIQEKRNDLDIYDIALHFGGDYELLVSIPPSRFKKVKSALEKIGGKLTAIGKTTKKEEITIKDVKTKKILENKGYEHFTNHIF